MTSIRDRVILPFLTLAILLGPIVPLPAAAAEPSETVQIASEAPAVEGPQQTEAKAPETPAVADPQPVVIPQAAPIEFKTSWVVDTPTGGFLGMGDCIDCFEVAGAVKLENGRLVVYVEGTNVAFADNALAELRVTVRLASGAEQLFIVTTDERNPGVGLKGPLHPTKRGGTREFPLAEPVVSITMKGDNADFRKNRPAQTWVISVGGSTSL